MSSPYSSPYTSLTAFLAAEVLASAGFSRGTGAVWVTITGSGGKTSLMESMAYRLAKQKDLRVIITTTTRLAGPADHSYPCDHMVLDGDLSRLDSHPLAGEVVLFGMMESGKIASPGVEKLDSLASRCDVLLFEGDGARQRPLKIHAERDPIIPSKTQLVIALMGLSAYGKPLDEDSCYLTDRYRELTGDRLHTIGAKMYRRLLDHPQGVFKGVAGQRVVLVLNQGDLIDPTAIESLKTEMIAGWAGIPYIFIAGSVQKDIVVHYEEVMGSNPFKGADRADI